MPIPAQFALGRRVSRTQGVGFIDFSDIASGLSDLTGNIVSESFFTGVLNTAGKIGVDIATKEIVSILGPDTRAGQVAQQAAAGVVNRPTTVSRTNFNEQAPPAVQPPAAPAASSDSTTLMLGLVAVILLTR